MKKSSEPQLTLRMSNAAVKAKTGKDWQEWFSILDATGAQQMDHKGIVALLSEQHGIGPWWRQMLAVGYEQARGMREKHQKGSGYEISVSRTMAVPVATLYQAWQDERVRSRWLPKTNLVIRKATSNKSLRITWADGKTGLDVNFYPAGRAKGRIVVQHNKLPDSKAAAHMKTYWQSALGRLKGVLGASETV